MPSMRNLRTLIKLQAVTFALAVLILPALFVLSHRALEQFAEARGIVQHTYDVLDQIDRIEKGLYQAENARRAFRSSKQDRYLYPYQEAKNEVIDAVFKVQDLVKDDPLQLEKLEAFTPLVQQLMTSIANEVTLLPGAKLDVQDFDTPNRMMEQIRHGADGLRTQAKSSLNDGRVVSEKNLRNLQYLLLGGSATFLIFFVITFVVLWRENRRHKVIETGLLESERVNQLTVKNLSLLSEMNNMLQASTCLNDSLAIISEFASRLMAVDSGGLFLFDDSQNQLEIRAQWGEQIGSELFFAPTSCWALRRGATHTSDHDHQGMICDHITERDKLHGICIPVSAQGSVLGVLHLHNHGGVPISTDDQRMADSLSSQIALALGNMKLRETLRNLSLKDPLTGLFNRRYLEEAVTRELAIAARKQYRVAFCILDIDHFKKFNDSFGHDTGDMLLKEVAAILERAARAMDIACRFGGEEFILILVDITPEIAIKRLNQLRQEIADMQLVHLGQKLYRVTASFGVAFYPQHGINFYELMHTADKALYSAKDQGRNRVEVAVIEETKSKRRVTPIK